MNEDQMTLLQQSLDKAYAIDLVRAESRMKEFVALGTALLESLPAHWHDEAITEFADLVQKTDVILRPAFFSKERVAVALKEYMGKDLQT